MAEIIRLKEALWVRFSELLTKPVGRGRRPASDKGCFEALVYLLRTGCQYSELPPCYPPKSTVYDAKARWSKAGVLEKLWAALLVEFDDVQGLEWEWLSADSATVKAPLSGEGTGKKSNR